MNYVLCNRVNKIFSPLLAFFSSTLTMAKKKNKQVRFTKLTKLATFSDVFVDHPTLVLVL